VPETLNAKRGLLSTEQPQIYIRDVKRHRMNGNSQFGGKVIERNEFACDLKQLSVDKYGLLKEWLLPCLFES